MRTWRTVKDRQPAAALAITAVLVDDDDGRPSLVAMGGILGRAEWAEPVNLGVVASAAPGDIPDGMADHLDDDMVPLAGLTIVPEDILAGTGWEADPSFDIAGPMQLSDGTTSWLIPLRHRR